MLSDDAKLVFTRAFEMARDEGSLPELQQLGPAEVVTQAIDELVVCAYECDNPKVRALPGNVQSNRPEAERFMAGLMGMM